MYSFRISYASSFFVIGCCSEMSTQAVRDSLVSDDFEGYFVIPLKISDGEVFVPSFPFELRGCELADELMLHAKDIRFSHESPGVFV